MNQPVAQLLGHSLTDTSLPAAWLPLITGLKAFGAAGDDQQPHDWLRALHDQLIADAATLLEPGSLDDDASHDVAFCTAVLLLPQFEAATTYGRTLIDTFGSTTLAAYQPDWSGDDADRARLRAWCVDRLGADQVAAIEAKLATHLEDGQRKARLIQAICERFKLTAEAAGEDDVATCFRAFYGDPGLADDEIRIVVSGCLIFFCLPFDGDHYTGPDDHPRKAELDAFFKRVDTFQQEQFAHFPVFGFLRGADVADDLVSDLATASGLALAEVRDELSHSIAFVPQKKVEQYIVHDVWGHGWQLAALDFEHMYQAMAGFGDPLTLAEVNSDGVRLADCLQQGDDGWQLDSERFAAFVDGEIAERLPVALSAAVAEMLADISEYKFLIQRPDLDAEMPSSSAFKDWPTKWDLGMTDIRFYYRQALKVMTWGLKPGNRRRAVLVAELSEQMTAAEAETIVGAMWTVWQEREATVWEPVLAVADAEGGGLRSNAFTRIHLGLLSTHRSLSAVTRELDGTDLTGTPFGGLWELLLLATACFFEADRSANIWRLDEFVEGPFRHRCRALLADWRAAASPALLKDAP